MVVLSGNRIAWTYTADDGTFYRVAAQKALTDQAKQGGTPAAGTVQPKPASLKMRRVTVHAAGIGSRVVPLYSVGAPLALSAETINANLGGDSHAFTSQGNPIPEGHHIHNVTSQST